MAGLFYILRDRSVLNRFLFALCLLLPCAGFGASVTASLDRNSAMAGESVVLSLAYEGGRPRVVPQLPQIPGLQIQYVGNQISAGFSNGTSYSQFILNFQVTPAREGVYRIPAIQSTVDGTLLTTQPLALTVSKNAQAEAQGEFAFIRLNVPRQEVYLGELIPVEVQLYIINGNVSEMPTLNNEGFVVSKTAKPIQTRTSLNGQIYNVVTVPMSISAAKAGKLSVGPAAWNVVLHLPSGRRRNNGFEPFEDLFGPRYEAKQVSLLSQTNSLNVLPVPRNNAPPGFNGALGNFKFTLEASPTNLIAGDPITLRFQFTGKGTLDALSLPRFDWPDFKLYPPTSTITNTDALGLEGTKTFEQIIVPQSSAVKEIPAFTFSFFDPEKKRFETVNQRAVALMVQPSPNQQQPSVAVKSDASNASPPPEPTDIVHIKTNPGPLIANAQPLIFQSWYLGVQLVPVAAWCLLLLNRRRVERIANDPKRQRRLRVGLLVKNALNQLDSLASANKTEEFFATLFRILQEQLGERLDRPAASITEAVLDEPLVTERVPVELIGELRHFFSLCNQARYAPDSNPGSLVQWIPRIRSAIGTLQKLQ